MRVETWGLLVSIEARDVGSSIVPNSLDEILLFALREMFMWYVEGLEDNLGSKTGFIATYIVLDTHTPVILSIVAA